VLCSCLGVTVGEVRRAGNLTPAEFANLLDLQAGECRMRRCGPYLGALVGLRPARPVPLAALAALASRAGEQPEPAAVQRDEAGLA
jgi:hypothetical protein